MMRLLLLLGLWLGSFLFPLEHCLAKPQIPVQLSLIWEGRKLQEPNIEALGRFRISFPNIPLTQLINPAYFLDLSSVEDNLRLMRSILQPDDEIGLYLAPVESLVRQSGVVLKLAPSFWGYFDEGTLCQDDCGLDVPLAVYNREEIFKIFSTANQTMSKVGFTQLRSLAVRGWLMAPFLGETAAAFGYRYDLTPVDPQLVAAKLREFPIAAWVAQSWHELADPDALSRFSSAGNPLQLVPQTGGMVELNEQREILARFDRFIKMKREHPGNKAVFAMDLTSETAFQSWPNLRLILQSMQERAKTQDFDLIFNTPASAKNGRPLAENMRISTKL